jgi:hypothetical protein
VADISSRENREILVAKVSAYMISPHLDVYKVSSVLDQVQEAFGGTLNVLGKCSAVIMNLGIQPDASWWCLK